MMAWHRVGEDIGFSGALPTRLLSHLGALRGAHQVVARVRSRSGRRVGRRYVGS